jgi:hypothetical protein
MKQLQSKLSFIRLIISLFVIASFILLPYCKYQFNPDAIAYLRIASYYQQGNFSIAINSYWSPLLSWLLVPFYVIGMQPVIAFYLINIIASTVCLWQLYKLLQGFIHLQNFAKYAFLTVAAVQLLNFQYSNITPDILTLSLLLFLLRKLLADEIFKQPFITGLLGAFLYFAKAYCFYFFIVIILIYTIYYFLTNKLFPAKALFKLIISFALPCLLWIGLMHSKYKAFQVSSAAAYNYAIASIDGVYHHPFEEHHLLNSLPYKEAYCLWEDPQSVYHYSTQKVLQDKNISWFLLLIKNNIRKSLGFIKYIAILLSLTFILLIITGKKRKTKFIFFQKNYKKLFFFTFIYIIGYWFIVVEERYVWLVIFISLIFLYKALDELLFLQKKFFHNSTITMVSLFMIYINIIAISEYINSNKDVYEYDKAIEKVVQNNNIATWYTTNLWDNLSLNKTIHNYGGIASYNNWDSLKLGLTLYNINYILINDTSVLSKSSINYHNHLHLYKQTEDWFIYTFDK